MSAISIEVLIAGIISTVVGLILQAIGHAIFLRHKTDDTKELAGVVGFRVSAIFGIAVGLIFGSTNAHFVDAKKDLLEETRLMGTLGISPAAKPITSTRPYQAIDRMHWSKSSPPTGS